MLRRHLLTGAALTLAACGGLDEFEEVIVEEASIPRSDTGITGPYAPAFGGGFSNIDLSRSGTFADEGISPDDVDAIYVKSVTLEVEHQSGDARLEELNLYVESMTMKVNATGQQEAMIAELPLPVPMTSTAELDVPMDFNLKPYATAEAMTVSATVNLAEPRGVAITIRTTIRLLIDVNILGQ